MIDTMPRSSHTHEMQAVNNELAELLRVEPMELALGAQAALADDLVICGILGGKDVGKSTLINALAQTQVSVDAREVGRGTEQPMVYVHEDVREHVDERLQALGRHVPIDVTLHQADLIRNVVLVDLPDFDSEFQAHHEVVRRVAPLLDRVLWVQTPRKIGDRALVTMFRDVVKDADNVHCVLNKVDELLADGELDVPSAAQAGAKVDPAESFWQHQDAWVAQVVTEVGFAQSPEHRFLVSAAFADPDAFTRYIGRRWGDIDWARYSADRATVERIAQHATQDLERLRACVLSPVSADQARALKQANQRREQGINVERLRRHYDLSRTLQHLTLACDAQYHEQVLAEALGADFSVTCAMRLGTRIRPDTVLADELLERRVEQWPLLRLVYWPFGWLSRALGRRLSVTRTLQTPSEADPFDGEGRSLADRVELARARVLADHAVIATGLGLGKRIPKASALAERALVGVKRSIPLFETQLLNDLCARDRRPGIGARAGLWFILLWFPFVQPVLEGGLALYVETGAWHWAKGLYRIVSAFSAMHLLLGFAVVAAVYVALLAGMYARCLRSVRSVLAGTDSAGPNGRLAESVDDVLTTEVLVPLIRPFQERLNRLSSLETRLERLASDPTPEASEQT
jgi:hypothetical protein